MYDIYVPADQVWPEYMEMVAQREDDGMFLAENYSTGIAICIFVEDDTTAMIEVDSDGVLLESVMVSEETAEATAEELYTDYISSNYIHNMLCASENEEIEGFDDEVGEGGYYTEKEIESEIEWRNEELREATQDYVDIILDGCKGDVDKVSDGLLADVMNVVIDHLTGLGISIRLPVFKKGSDGKYYYTEYPFGE